MRIVPIPIHHVRVINRCIFSFAVDIYARKLQNLIQDEPFYSFPSTLLLFLLCSLVIFAEKLGGSSVHQRCVYPHFVMGFHFLTSAPPGSTFSRTLGKTHHGHQSGVRSSVRSLFSFRLHHATYCSSQFKLCKSIQVRKSVS